MAYSLLDVQKQLKAKGFNPGPLDGQPGRLTTAAVAAFQSANGLKVQWPGTIGPTTLAALFGGAVEKNPPPLSAPTATPWIDLALRKKGLHESRNKSEVAAFLKSDGKTLGDPTKLPWCGDFVETCIAVTLPGEPLPVNPYLARNWLKFGVSISPTRGAVGAFWRGSRSGTSGHVAFLMGQDSTAYHILGGNQSDSISITRIAKDRLLGARWPVTVPKPKIFLPAADSKGRLSTNES